ncbi:MAG: cytochrome P450 [Myxococcota bacterium]
MTDVSSLPLPPGSRGLPLVGETLRFLSDGVNFVESRVERLGPVFRSHILGRHAAFICGPDATELFMDDARVMRAGAMPGNVERLFAGHVLTVLDGEEHRERKSFVMAAMTPDALASYVPGIRRLARALLDRLASAGPTALVPELKKLSIGTIAEVMFGISSGPIYEQLAADYQLIIDGLVAVPVPLPGTAYSKAKKALTRTLATFAKLIAEHKARPSDDGLARILAATSAKDGKPLADDVVASEVHHVVIAGFILWTWYVAATRHLAERPALVAMLRREVDGLPASYGPAELLALHGLSRGVMEIQRLTPVLPMVFGRAKTDFAYKGHRIPAGWMVLWAWHSTHIRPEVYAKPKEFDPGRFDAGRAEHKAHPCAFSPQGAGDPTVTHKCAGHELAPLILRVFLVELLRGFDVALAPGQDLSADPARLPPEPRSGLVATVTRRAV